MTSIFLNNAVTVLTHDRLRVLRDALKRKKDLHDYGGEDLNDAASVTTVVHQAVEDHVRQLIERTLPIFESGARTPTAPGAPRANGTSKYAILGGAGYQWPSLGDVLNRRKTWLTNLARRGSPDPSMSHVVGPSTRIALRAVELGLGYAAGDATKSAQIRAFGMGMMCSVGASVALGPLIRGAASRTIRDAESPWADATVVARVESAVRRHIFGNLSSSSYAGWWPTAAGIPDELIRGYLEAVNEAAGGWGATRPLGFADFETGFRTGPEIDAAWLRSSYQLTRDGASTWNFLEWFGWLMFFSIPTAIILPIASAPDWSASRLFKKDMPGAPDLPASAWTQVGTAALFATAIGPIATSIYLRTQLPGQSDAFDWFIGTSIVDIIAVLVFIYAGQDSAHTGAQWLTFLVPVALRLVHFIQALARSGADARFFHMLAFPFWATGLSLLVALACRGIVNDADTEDQAKDRVAGMLGGWGAIVLVVQVIVALVLDGKSLVTAIAGTSPSKLADVDALPSGGSTYSLARLVDDSTLWAAAAPNAGRVGLATLRYPPGNRPLLRMWWAGEGNLEVSHAGNKMRFRIDSGTPQEIVLPPIAFTPAALGAYLSANVTGRPPGTPGASGGLLVEAILSGTSLEAAHPLPYPEVVDDTRGEFKKVDRSRDKAYELRHASREQLSTSYGREGPAVSRIEGWPIGPGASPGGAEGTGIGFAADLAAMLAIGAASHFPPPAVGAIPGPPAVGHKVHQVFRQWNLDERRVNEWRMLIAGGAMSEKQRVRPAPSAGDDAMLPGAQATAPAVQAGTEALANAMGWVPAFRAWSRIATDPEQDATATRAAPYTASVQIGAGAAVKPTNSQLSDVMRYLFDLP